MDAKRPTPPVRTSEPTSELCDLESIIATAELASRGSRKANSVLETEILLKLNHELAAAPQTFFQKLVEAVLLLSNADSSGVSLLNVHSKRFIWPAVAGPFHAYLWEGTPSDFGPCGTVLERNATQLMRRPERHFTYLKPITPGLEEVLLVPFYVDGKTVGTIWAVIHEPGKSFDREDQRLLESLSTFAASAYKTLSAFGTLEPMLHKKSVQRRPAASASSAGILSVSDSPRHQCMVYQGAPSTHLGSVAQTLLQRLKSNYRCLYLNSPTMVAGMRWHLVAAGLDLDRSVASGALILTSERGHLIEGKFDTERMIAALGEAVNQAQSDGFVGLFAAGDMTWEFGHEVNLEKLLDYERRLELSMQNHAGLCGICLYHRDTLPAHAIETALITHRTLYVSATLSQLNPSYLDLAKVD